MTYEKHLLSLLKTLLEEVWSRDNRAQSKIISRQLGYHVFMIMQSPYRTDVVLFGLSSDGGQLLTSQQTLESVTQHYITKS